MSWMKETKCPVCGTDGFDPDCDEVDIGVGVQEGNLRGVCRRCGNVAVIARAAAPRRCPRCGGAPTVVVHPCPTVVCTRCYEPGVEAGVGRTTNAAIGDWNAQVECAEDDNGDGWELVEDGTIGDDPPIP